MKCEDKCLQMQNSNDQIGIQTSEECSLTHCLIQGRSKSEVEASGVKLV